MNGQIGEIQIDSRYLLDGKISNRLKTIFGIARIRPDGYFHISSSRQGYGKRLLHRVIFEEFYQTKLPKHIVIHHNDGNKLNNMIWNLIPMTRSEHADLHLYHVGVSEETCKKLRNPRKTIPKFTLETKMNMSKAQNTTGYFRVSKQVCERCKQGFMWRYAYTDEKGNFKQFRSVSLEKLKKRVLSEGLVWKKFDSNEVISMPTPLEEELRAVQSSITYVKRKIDEEPADSRRCKLMQSALSMYQEEEERILKELNR